MGARGGSLPEQVAHRETPGNFKWFLMLWQGCLQSLTQQCWLQKQIQESAPEGTLKTDVAQAPVARTFPYLVPFLENTASYLALQDAIPSCSLITGPACTNPSQKL